MYKRVGTIESFDHFFNACSPQRLRLLFFLREWKAVSDVQEMTGLTRGGVSYHLELLRKMNLVESRRVKWKTTYRKEYRTIPMVLMVDFGGIDTGSKEDTQTTSLPC